MRLTPAQIELASQHNISVDPEGNGFDYANQAWIVDGRYAPCGHSKPCECYGTKHELEVVRILWDGRNIPGTVPYVEVDIRKPPTAHPTACSVLSESSDGVIPVHG